MRERCLPAKVDGRFMESLERNPRRRRIPREIPVPRSRKTRMAEQVQDFPDSAHVLWHGVARPQPSGPHPSPHLTIHYCTGYASSIDIRKLYNDS